MPKFTYSGEDQEGKKKLMKTITAEDRYAVYDIARRDGDRVTSIEESSDNSLTKFFNLENQSDDESGVTR